MCQTSYFNFDYELVNTPLLSFAITIQAFISFDYSWLFESIVYQ